MLPPLESLASKAQRLRRESEALIQHTRELKRLTRALVGQTRRCLTRSEALTRRAGARGPKGSVLSAVLLSDES
jgi:hypothetical protein